VTEVNAPAQLYPCVFCKCVFFSPEDLSRHLLAFKDRDTPINLRDHTAKFREAHYRLECGGYEAE
jgi:hypothetical protein